MIANCPNCGKLVEGIEFTAEQKRKESYQGTNRESLFACPKCKKYWYGSKMFPKGNILKED